MAGCLLMWTQFASALMGPESVFDEFLTLYEQYGGEQYMLDEQITQRSHVLQAAHFASLAGAPEAVVIGLLLHDVGQISDARFAGQTDQLHHSHDSIGAQWADSHGLPPQVSEWIEYHTLAKMHLCEQDIHYYDHLSQASKDSLEIQRVKYQQGQPAAITYFAASPHLEDHLASRRCDDMAKQVDFDSIQDDPKGALPGFESYRGMFERVIRKKGQAAGNPEWHQLIEQMQANMWRDPEQFLTQVKSRDIAALSKPWAPKRSAGYRTF